MAAFVRPFPNAVLERGHRWIGEPTRDEPDARCAGGVAR